MVVEVNTLTGQKYTNKKWGKPICLLSPVLFDLSEDKNITVFEFLQRNGQIRFSRWLPPILFDRWMKLVNKVFSYQFEN